MPQNPHVVAGKYELVEVAGEGGMATVWRALMRGAAGFARPVALKRILPALASNEEFVAMFVEEARVGSTLLHPNIVQIIDFGSEGDDNYFLVMEWVEGIDFGRYLAAYLLAHQLAPWPIVAAVGIEALRGLGAAHERCDAAGNRAPVIHRDVTPQNILLGENGVIKLTDFGLARAMDRARMTQPDVIKGKLRYLAPEVTYGKPATALSDLFSLGIVLWEALSGKPLYDAATDVMVFQKARAAEIPPLGSFRTDLPPELVAVVERSLAKDAAQRYESARTMLRALSGVLRGVTQSTDAYAISDSVRFAMQTLGEAPKRGGGTKPPPVPSGAR
jgi:eukaryotic-like serine/threonine-protein kinase